MTELRVIQNCDRCAGDNAEGGCPAPRGEVPEVLEIYWPPNPDPDSWTCDTPNEGISYEKSSDGSEGICSYGADYHGFYLLFPHPYAKQPKLDYEWEFPTDEGRPVPYFGEQNPLYTLAYIRIRKALELGIPIELCVRGVLTGMGWKQVETCVIETEESTIYWKWKD